MSQGQHELDLLNEQQKRDHVKRVLDQVDLVIARAPGTFERILDIGGGVSEQSREFHERFGSEYWIVEGNSSNNSRKRETAVKSKWREHKDDFLYYHDLNGLRAKLQSLGARNFHLVDADVLDVDPTVKFDLICSWKSCGYHYPVNTYRDFILAHSNANTRIIMDIRLMKGSLKLDSGWKVIRELYQHKDKYRTCMIEFET